MFKRIVPLVGVITIIAVSWDAFFVAAVDEDTFQEDLHEFVVDKISEYTENTGNEIFGEDIWDILSMQFALAGMEGYQAITSATSIVTGEYGVLENGEWVYYPCTLLKPYAFTGQNVGKYISEDIAIAPHFTIRAIVDIAVDHYKPDENYLYISGLPGSSGGGFSANSVEWSRPCIYGLECTTNFFSSNVQQYSDGAAFSCFVSCAMSPPGFQPSNNGAIPGAVCGRPRTISLPTVDDTPESIANNDTPEKYYTNVLYPYLQQIASQGEISQEWIYHGTASVDPTEPARVPIATIPFTPFYTIETELVEMTNESGEVVTEIQAVTNESGAEEYVYNFQMPSLPPLEVVDGTLPLEISLDTKFTAGMGAVWALIKQILDISGLIDVLMPFLVCGLLLYILTKLG